MELHRCCSGDWRQLQMSVGLSEADMIKFLDYAVVFLQNIGNYYVSPLYRSNGRYSI